MYVCYTAVPSACAVGPALHLPAGAWSRGAGCARGGGDVGLHRGEQQHLLDVCAASSATPSRTIAQEQLTLRVREEHDEAVDADAPSTGGRETVLEPVKGPSVAERQK